VSFVSLLNPKLTNRLKSENTSRFCSPNRPLAPSPVGGPLSGGDPKAANRLSPAAVAPLMPPFTSEGRDTRLPPGLAKVICAAPGGSMSKEDKNEMLSNSVFVLVMVKNESSSLLCSVLGVPFRSRI
jgi:hypothetical protein